MNAFMIGQITPQVAIISKEPVMELLMVIGQEAGIQPALTDPAMGRSQESDIDAAMEELAGQDPSDDPAEAMMMMTGEEEGDMNTPPLGIMAPPPQEDGMDMMAMMVPPEDEELLQEDV
jgi:hypothetical protein